MTREQKDVEVPGVDPWGLRRVERLLRNIEGVNSLKIVPDGHGGIDEIHVLSASGLGAKQIVRNIESALLAQFGLQVDHRKISIAQMRDRDLEPAALEEPEPEPIPSQPRLILESFHMERTAGERVRCRVRLLNGEAIHEGEAEGPDYAKSRLEVSAQAVLNALARSTDGRVSFAIEGVTQIDLFGRHLVVAVIQGFAGRRSIALPGISEMGDSVEEGVVYACLSATNRWITNL